MSEKDKVIILIFCLTVVIVSGVVMRMYFRRKMTAIIEEIGESIDSLTGGERRERWNSNEDMLVSKIQYKLERLSEVTMAAREESAHQKEEVQKMVSDISHQLKTPIANITMYNDTILNRQMPEEQEYHFLNIMKNQVEKLDFLVQSLMKMSRLENSMIQIRKEKNFIYDTVLEVVENLSLQLERKQIDLQIDCPEDISACYDRKWTGEALFNVVDNAVKYTPEHGAITIKSEMLGMFLKIEVMDNGIGIAAEHITDIFKRFYREEKVHNEEGIGIGLYLTREIVTRQGGYMKVQSKEGTGSRFSIYLPKDEENSRVEK